MVAVNCSPLAWGMSSVPEEEKSPGFRTILCEGPALMKTSCSHQGSPDLMREFNTSYGVCGTPPVVAV